MNFEEYLSSKKIDSDTFRQAEPSTWEAWKTALEQMHPNSFTIQKLNLINPVRRKYPLKQSGLEKQGARSKEQEAKAESSPVEKKEIRSEGEASSQATSTSQHTNTPTPPTPKPGVARPVFKPKPKIN